MFRRAPVLAGTTLNVFVRLLESFLGSLILLKLRRDSGIPQALADVSLPERPSYYAVHPQLQEKHECWLPLAESSAPDRANAAAQEVPGRRSGACSMITWPPCIVHAIVHRLSCLAEYIRTVAQLMRGLPHPDLPAAFVPVQHQH